MNHFWSLALLVCLSGCSALQLQNLCKEDHFTYNGILVNSVHLQHKEETLKEVFNYAIDPYELCEEDSKGYREIKDTILGIKKKFNQLVVRIYSSRYMNDAKTNKDRLDTEENQINEWIKELNKLKGKLGWFGCIEKKFIGKMDAMKNFFRFSRPFLDRRFPNSDQLYLHESFYSHFRLMLNDISYMRTNVNAGQVGAFKKEFDIDVFRKPLLTRPKFVFIRKSKIIYDFNSYLIQNYDVVYPFHSKEFDESKPCLKAADLSPFYTDENARKPYN